MHARKEATGVHEKLNREAICGIVKAIEEGCEWQEDLAVNISRKNIDQSTNTLLIPTLKKAAAKFHLLYDTRKDEALKEHKVEQQVILKIRGKGQWNLAKHLGGKNLPPLSAVKRNHSNVG